MTGLLDVLKETALETQFLDCFESSASREALAPDVRNRRLLLALYALGTNAGLKRVAAGVADVSIDELAHVHRRYCENQSGRYTQRQGVPYCILEAVVFLGEWRAVTTEYWWNRRKDDREDRRIAILWLVAPEHSSRLVLECTLAAMAVHNPAKLPSS